MAKTDTTKENALRFLLDSYTFLSLSFSEQMKQRGCLGDGLTDDIAEDCDFAYLSYFLSILKSNGVLVDSLQLLMAQISDVFTNKSRGSTHYDPDFWTFGALKDSPLWDEQRKRAAEILVILKKV